MTTARPLWAAHRTLWRWHFYAGLFCIPFVIWLALTGSVYLFKPQIEALMDRPYANLALARPAQAPSAIAGAAVAAVPGSTLRAYRLPIGARDAVQVEVSRGPRLTWVYVRPDDLRVLKVVDEDDRLMAQVFRLHGELMIGDRGSNLVELAACWAIVMLITGLCLWWPRGSTGLAGVVWPRLGGGLQRTLRDLHAVTGFWISIFALFLLLTGLPWAKNWGGYLKEMRRLAGATAPMDWTAGRADELARRRAFDASARAAAAAEHADHMAGHAMAPPPGAAQPYASLDRALPGVAALGLPPPVLIAPPTRPAGPWMARSDTPNRPQRVNLTLDPETGVVLQRTGFDQKHWIDQAVGVGVAAHEGQLFGPLNQALGILTALGLVVLSATGLWMWLRRRPQAVLGAPAATGEPPPGPAALAVVGLLCLYLPLLGASLVAVLLVERLVLSRIAPVAAWLGLSGPPRPTTSP